MSFDELALLRSEVASQLPEIRSENKSLNAANICMALIQSGRDYQILMQGRHMVDNAVYQLLQRIPGVYAGDDEINQYCKLKNIKVHLFEEGNSFKVFPSDAAGRSYDEINCTTEKDNIIRQAMLENTTTIKLYKTQNHYMRIQSLRQDHVETIPKEKVVLPTTTNVTVVRNELVNEHFNRLLQTTFTAMPEYLEGIHAVLTFCLVPLAAQFEDIPLVKNTVYFQVVENSLAYRVKSSSGIMRGCITKKDLNHTITASFNTEDLARFRPTILTLLSKAEKIQHCVSARPAEYIDPVRTPYLTQTEGRVSRLDVLQEAQNAQALLSSDRVKLRPSQPIGSFDDWGTSLIKSAAMSALISTARFDIAAVITMVSMGTIEFAPLAMASLPFFLVCFSLSMGASVFGKHYAIKYEEAIRTANSLLNAGDYVGAIRALDTEFSRWFGARSARHSFLTSEHYAMAHFLRGTCAIIEPEHFDYQRAYNEFDAAAKDAKKANHLSLLMIAQLQKISLLKKGPSGMLPAGRSPEQTIDEIISELTEFFPNAFSDLYWKFNDKIAQLSTRLRKYAPWNENEITIINQYLISDATYMLKHFAAGRGQFMEVFFIFFQSMVLASIHQTNLNYLTKESRKTLSEHLGNPPFQDQKKLKEFILCLTVKKLRTCVEQLKAFKQQQPALFKDPDIANCIERIKEFAKGLHFPTSRKTPTDDIRKDLNEINKSLAISSEEINRYICDVDTSIVFLTDLAVDFNHRAYQTMDELLDAIIAPNRPLVSCVSSKTGDTMLHRLAALPLMPALKPRIHEAAKCLLASLNVRNHLHETPLFTLRNKADPHGLLAIIDAAPMIKLGKELDMVDAFLEKIKTDPTVEGHFLLLDGPPGTGKTSTVQDHLAKKGYSVKIWDRGSENDRKVGGLPTRIQEFFTNARKAAATSNRLQILFIDEIHRITPLSLGGPTDPQYHNKDDDTATFQTEITGLKGHKVVLIGATDFPAQLAKAMLSRAATNRIHFPLPNEEQRIKLLNFFFRAKAIDSQYIVQLAKVAVAYAPRELQSFVNSIKEDCVTQLMMINYFYQYARTLSTAFKDEFPFADLFMPSFENEGDLADTFSSNAELAEQLVRLKSDVSSNLLKHTLLYGPPGSGKTTAVRIFAQTSGRVLIAIQAEESSSKDMLRKLFDRAKQLSPAIIFFDEMHNIAQHGTRLGTFLQTEMDGITQNNITIIGATNYPERFEDAILSRFTSKIELPRLSAEALAKPIRRSLLDKVKDYQMPVYVDSALAHELNSSPATLGRECEGLSLRLVNAAFGYLMEDLRNANTHSGITYLRLQDVVFSVLKIKIQERIAARPVGDMTRTAYIHQHRLSFFPVAIPEGSVQACSPSL
jgi:SpoVK/Ycf46/Vps4 family AAA+-type ATPase